MNFFGNSWQTNSLNKNKGHWLECPDLGLKSYLPLSSCVITRQLGASISYTSNKEIDVDVLQSSQSWGPSHPKNPCDSCDFSVRQTQANIKRNCFLNQDYLNWYKPGVRRRKKEREKKDPGVVLAHLFGSFSSCQLSKVRLSLGKLASRDTSSVSVIIRVSSP